ncbi:MAG: aminotransferase class V-fold PLP-dependent enzyme [Acidimicrobiales bacterium]
MISLNQSGRPVGDVIAELSAKRDNDVKWREGKTFGLVYDGGPEVHEVAERAAAMYLHENALNTQAFPSLGDIQREVVGWTASLLSGPETASGFMTSGGTESILCGVKAARERGRIERGITEPEMVLTESAHAAFHKAAHLFGIKVHKTKVRDDWTADVDAMANAMTDNTVLLVGSAPQYPQGVIDDIPAIAALAQSADANWNVIWADSFCCSPRCWDEACLGFPGRWGFVDFGRHSQARLLAQGRLGDLHRTKELRKYQTFLFSDWLGGFYASPNMQGTRSGLPMAAAWAVMNHLGVDGYKALVAQTLDNADRIRAGIAEIDGICTLGSGAYQLVALSADPTSDDPVDAFALGDALMKRGWYLDRQGPPDSLHSTVSNSNTGVVDDYLDALRASVDEVRGTTADDRSTVYSTLD